MAMSTVVRRLEFDAGHRLVGHEGKCRYPHGHRYVVEVYGRGSLDPLGRVVDFSVIKEMVGGFIDSFWDHGFLVNASDHQLIEFLHSDRAKLFIFQDNPTAENIARYLIDKSQVLLFPYGVEVYKLVVWETPNCRAEVQHGENSA